MKRNWLVSGDYSPTYSRQPLQHCDQGYKKIIYGNAWIPNHIMIYLVN
jgi:hypothetical protein